MTGRVRVDDTGLRAYAARVADLARVRVRVGVLSDEAVEGADLTMGELAAIHEFGAPAAGIPARSFLRATIDARRAELRDLQLRLTVAVLDGKVTARAAAYRLGATVAGWVQDAISAGIPPPNAEATVRAKGSSTPLVDVGTLRASVTWDVLAT